MPIFKAYGDSSFQDCKKASEEAITNVIKNLQGKLFSDSESIQVRAESAVLLKQLDFPVNNLKAKLLEKLEQSIADIRLSPGEINNGSGDLSPSASAHKAATHEFMEAVRALLVIFPDSEKQLVKLSQDLVTKNFAIAEEYVKTRIHPADLLGVLGVVWNDVLLIDEVLPEAALSHHSLEVIH
jgi:hypothetical protein